MGQTPSQKQLEVIKKTVFTAEQVLERSRGKECWVIINRNVYNVSNYLHKHPGGAQVIRKFSGQDCTDTFKMIHKQIDKALQLLSQYQVGVLVD
jgi:cytochrome b involved in lipid metabolism